MALSREEVLMLLDGKDPRPPLDEADRHLLIAKAIEVVRGESDINLTAFGWKIGISRTRLAGLEGCYKQLAKQIIERQSTK